MFDRKIDIDLYSNVCRQENQNKSCVYQSKQDGCLNGILINLDNNSSKNNQLKRVSKKQYDEIIAKLSKIVQS